MFRTGGRGADGPVRATILPGPGSLGVAAAKKTGDKPRRNLVRRRLREASRIVGRPSGFDLILMGQPAAADLPFPDLLRCVRSAVARAEAAWAEKSASS